MKTEEPRYVCHVCIGDQVLTKQVEEENTPAECSYCQLTKPALTLAGLSNRIRQVLEEHFIPVPENDDPEQSRQGLKDIETVIEAVAHLEQGIAADVREYLFNRLACTVNVAGGEENPYSHGMLYEEREADTSDLRSAWWTLDEAIRSRARFFGATTVDILDKIFENLDSLRTIGNKSVIREIKPNETDSTFWRARTALSAWEIKPIIESLSSQLGPPPSDKATAGRMNAEGIPVFYGALEEQTCVSEVRAPVGSYVVLVKFDLLNPISVLDLTELSNLYSDVSHFDPNYIERRSWASFLEQLAGEMSRPVMRPLGEHRYAYIWADGVYLSAGAEQEKTALLCVLGAREDGAKDGAGLPGEHRELGSVGDGALGLWAALDQVSPPPNKDISQPRLCPSIWLTSSNRAFMGLSSIQPRPEAADTT